MAKKSSFQLLRLCSYWALVIIVMGLLERWLNDGRTVTMAMEENQPLAVFPLHITTHVDEFLCIFNTKQPDNPPVPFRLSRHLSVCLLSRFSVFTPFRSEDTRSQLPSIPIPEWQLIFTGSVTTSDSLQSEWLAYYTGQWQLIINCHPNAAITKINIGCYDICRDFTEW